MERESELNIENENLGLNEAENANENIEEVIAVENEDEDEENDFDLENVIEFEGGMDELLKDLLTETFNCSLKLTFKKVPNIQGTSKFKVQKVSKIQDAATYIVL